MSVAYDSDLEHVEETLLGVAVDESLVRESPSPRVRFRGFGDSAVDVELLVWVADPVLRGRSTHLLVKAVHAAFREAGITIPFPQREVRMLGDGMTASATAGNGEVTSSVPDAESGLDGRDVTGAD